MGLQLLKTKFVDGIWEGVLTGTEAMPQLSANHMGQPLDAPRIEQHPEAGWRVTLALPTSVLSDGVQTVVIAEEGSDAPLAQVHVMAGEPLDDDLRAEVQLLREELDMLKRAFRRHRVETT